MKKFFRIFILINITCTILLGTIFLDYKKSQAAPVIPYAIWGVSETVLALFGAFGLEVGIKNAYSDHKVLDKDALNILQDFRGFLANGAGLMALPYNAIETQLNTLERMLADAQVKGYLELIRGNVIEKLTVTPNGPIKNKHEKSLIDSIKAYVVTRQVIEKSNIFDNQVPIGDLYDGDFYYNALKKAVIDSGAKWCKDLSTDFYKSVDNNIHNYFNNYVTPSDSYYFGYRIRPARYNYEGPFLEFYYPDLNFSKSNSLDSNSMAMYRIFLYPTSVFTESRELKLNADSGEGVPFKEFISSTNWKPLLDYKEGKIINDLGTDGRITVNPDISKLIDRDGNMDNFEIVTPGTIIQPDGGLDGNITIPVPKTFPENEPLPAGQTKPKLEYGTQIDYGTGTNLNGQTNIVDLPVPNPVPSTDWTADEISTNEKSKSLVTIFPFCIPFDLIAAFKLLKATPEVPHWEFDWTIPSLNFSHHFVIDLSMFNILFIILNKMLLLSFIVALILLTRTIIRG